MTNVNFPALPNQPATAAPTHIVTDNLEELLSVLPAEIAAQIAPEKRGELIEIVLDLGRKPEARFAGNRYEYLRESEVTKEELFFVETRLGAFGDDNRAGIAATLHRISAIRNRRGEIVGLTLRVGRAVVGIVDILRDLIEGGGSLLLMGRPGLGKTTLLREMARVLADEAGKRVIIVDTSNEIAGDGDVPHPAIGRARRMQVAQVSQQHDVMIEAVENHMPEVVVIDEIGRVEEALAARTIAERGVQLVATVHGNTLENLLANPSLGDLIGGIGAVTLSDEEARRRGTQKTVLERKAPPTFDVVVEMIERDKIAVRAPVSDVVDALLRGLEAPPEIRFRDENGQVQIELASTCAEESRSSHDFEMRAASSRSASARAPHMQRETRGESRRGEKRGASTRARETGNNARDRRNARRAMERYGDDNGVFLEDHLAPELRVLQSREYSQRDNSLSDAPFNAVENFAEHRDDSEDSKSDFSDTIAFSADELQRSRIEDDRAEDDEKSPRIRPDAPLDVSRVHNLYPFGVSRSRLSRAIKQLGLPLGVARTWREADGVLMLTGSEGVPLDSTLLKAPREMGLPIIAVEGNTYAQILSRLNSLYAGGEAGAQSPREMAMREANNAAQRVLAEAEPVELRPQAKPMRRAQHQLAEKFHLRSYSVGREPNRRVRFLPNLQARVK